MLSLTAFADELEREKGRQRTRDAMVRKAQSGHVTGGWCYGYRNIDVPGIDGKRSNVVREIEPTEAAIIRRIFQVCAEGYGIKAIAKRLNAEGAPSPRAQQGARRRGRRRPSVPCCTDPSTAASWCGGRRRSGISGAGTIRAIGLKVSGFGGRRRSSGSSVTKNGKRRTAGSRRRARSILRPTRASRSAGPRSALRRNTY